MLQSEFETHTDIFPDALLYDAADHEYMTGDWDSKAGFCHDFKFNVDGIAQKCQKIANERWIKVNEEVSRLRENVRPLTDRCEKLVAENARLEDENENLRAELSALTERVDKLGAMLGNPAGPEITIQSIRSAIQQAYQDAAHDDCKGDQILHMVWGFEYLMQRLGAE